MWKGEMFLKCCYVDMGEGNDSKVKDINFNRLFLFLWEEVVFINDLRSLNRNVGIYSFL